MMILFELDNQYPRKQWIHILVCTDGPLEEAARKGVEGVQMLIQAPRKFRTILGETSEETSTNDRAELKAVFCRVYSLSVPVGPTHPTLASKHWHTQ